MPPFNAAEISILHGQSIWQSTRPKQVPIALHLPSVAWCPDRSARAQPIKKPTVLPWWVFQSFNAQLACASVELIGVTQAQVELTSISTHGIVRCTVQSALGVQCVTSG